MRKNFLLFSLIMILMCIAGCGLNGNSIEKTGKNEEFTLYSCKVFEEYQPYIADYNENNASHRRYCTEDGNIELMIEQGRMPFCSFEAIVDERKSWVMSDYNLELDQINGEEKKRDNGDKCYLMSYEYFEDEKEYCVYDYLYYAENSVLSITASGEKKYENKIKKDVVSMGETIEYNEVYIDDAQKEYPFKVTSQYANVSIDEGLADSNLGYEDANRILIYIRGLDSYDEACGTFFGIQCIVKDEYGESISDFLEDEKEHDIAEGKTVETVRLGDVWPLINKKYVDIEAIKISEDALCDEHWLETYMFPYNDIIYRLYFMYNIENEDSKAKLYNIVNSLELN